MIPDLDIWRSANLMIQQHGDLADIEAATRADELLAKGDIPCNDDEGGPAGRRKGKPCDNRFSVAMRIKCE